MSMNVKFVVDERALGQVLLRVILLSVSKSCHQNSISIFISTSRSYHKDKCAKPGNRKIKSNSLSEIGENFR